MSGDVDRLVTMIQATPCEPVRTSGEGRGLPNLSMEQHSIVAISVRLCLGALTWRQRWALIRAVLFGALVTLDGPVVASCRVGPPRAP